ncbi:MAG TPA: hypothetical protein VH475_28620, partial [Tepidisphaeraceae bacterium]
VVALPATVADTPGIIADTPGIFADAPETVRNGSGIVPAAAGRNVDQPGIGMEGDGRITGEPPVPPVARMGALGRCFEDTGEAPVLRDCWRAGCWRLETRTGRMPVIRRHGRDAHATCLPFRIHPLLSVAYSFVVFFVPFVTS